MDFIKMTIKEMREGLGKKDFSSLELTSFYLEQINKKEKDIDAFLQIDIEGAKKQAKAIDERIAKGEELGSLAGVPCAIKDAIMVEGLNCTSGSKMLENYKAVYDATCVANLKKQDAIILGKTNMDEFAMGSSTEHSAFKTTKNPHDLKKVPGGSSGGSAACVAGDEAVFSLGSDTGGSIRQPASFCGVVGLKPTYGAVSRYGLIAFASSLDQIGPIAKTVEDCEQVFKAIIGKDEKDSTSIDINPKIQETRNKQIQNLKLGIPREFFGEGLENKTKEIIEGVIKKLKKEGAKIVEVSLPSADYALACYYILATCEASANLARFDGIRYGESGIRNQESGIKNLFEVYSKTRGRGFGDEVKRRIMLGTFALSSGYYDAYYTKAKKVQALIKQDFSRAFEKADFILTPTSPFPAFNIAEKIDDPLKMYLSDIYTVPINLAGVPALSMPAGLDGNLPVGLQIIGKHFSDFDILQLAKIIEKF